MPTVMGCKPSVVCDDSVWIERSRQAAQSANTTAVMAISFHVFLACSLVSAVTSFSRNEAPLFTSGALIT